MRWKSKGWLITLGVSSIIASLMTFVIPVVVTIGEQVALQGKYQVSNKEYFVKFGLVTLAIGVIMVGIKNIAFKVKKVEYLDESL